MAGAGWKEGGALGDGGGGGCRVEVDREFWGWSRGGKDTKEGTKGGRGGMGIGK